MVLTTRAVCRNSPLSERPSTSSAMVCERSPFATAPMTRATSVEGCTRSPIRLLTESRHSAQPPEAEPRLARWLILPSLPTARLMRVELARHPLVELEDVVERVGDLARHPGLVHRQAGGEIAIPKGDQGLQQEAGVQCVGNGSAHSINS